MYECFSQRYCVVFHGSVYNILKFNFRYYTHSHMICSQRISNFRFTQSYCIVTLQRFQRRKADLSVEWLMKFDEEQYSFGWNSRVILQSYNLNWQFHNKSLCSFNKLCGLLISTLTPGVSARLRECARTRRGRNSINNSLLRIPY